MRAGGSPDPRRVSAQAHDQCPRQSVMREAAVRVAPEVEHRREQRSRHLRVAHEPLEAHEEAQRIINQARENILQEVKTCRLELKKEAIDNSLRAAKELIANNYSREDQKKTLDEILAKVKESRQ